MSDILQAARDRILDENRKALPYVPKDLKQTWEKQAAWAGAMAGALTGGMIGSHIGLALGPLGAIASTVPGAIIGGIIGAFGAGRAGAAFEKPQKSIPQSAHLRTMNALAQETKDYCNSCQAETTTTVSSYSGVKVCVRCNSANLRNESHRLLSSSPLPKEDKVSENTAFCGYCRQRKLIVPHSISGSSVCSYCGGVNLSHFDTPETNSFCRKCKARRMSRIVGNQIQPTCCVCGSRDVHF